MEPRRACKDALLALMLAVIWSSQVSYQQTRQEIAPEIMTEINSINRFSPLELQVGSTLFMSIQASGTNPMRYIWSQNGIVVKNDTANSLQYPTADVSKSGIYRCLITNSYGAVKSLPFTLAVKELGEFPTGSDVAMTVQEWKFTVLNMPNISRLQASYQVEWQENEAPISVESHRYYVSMDYNMVLLDVPVSFSGRRFRAKLTHITTQIIKDTFSHNFIISVTASSANNNLPPEFVIRPKDTTVTAGKDVKFECVVSGQPFSQVQIYWYRIRDGLPVRINSGGQYRLSPNSRVLTVTTVTQGEAGFYECEGSMTGQTSVKQRVQLTVLVPPAFSVDSVSLRKDFQESLVLPCEATGSPPPELTWYYNGVKLADLGGTRPTIYPNRTLYIESLDSADTGVYQCVAVNEAGEDFSYTSLAVNSATPTIVEAPKSKTVVEKDAITFTCVAIGGPKPDLYWSKDGVNVTNGVRSGQTFSSSQLLIGVVEMSHSGRYTCHAVNIKGLVTATATLTVIVKTQIIRPPQNMSKPVSSDVELECGVRSDPSITPTLTWYFYPAPDYVKQAIGRGLGNKQVLPSGSLSIVGVVGGDSGKYECVVTSEGGNDSRLATLNVIDLPSRPVILRVRLHSNPPNSVFIDWVQAYDGDTPILKFIVQSRQESSQGATTENDWKTMNSSVDPSLRSGIFSGLLPARYYRFRIIAVNKVGESEPSVAAPEQEAIRMPPQPPSAAPKLYVRQGQEQEIVVQWDPPPEDTWNGDLLGYLIYYKVDRFEDIEEKIENVTGKDRRTVTIGNLAYYKKYRVKITAYNEKGPGMNSSDFYVTTLQGRPVAAPQNVILISPNSTTIRTEWEPPPTRLINGVNQGYEIAVKEGGNLKKLEIVRHNDSNPEKQTYDIMNLSKYTEYEIQIACRTVVGPGPMSAPQFIRTLEDVPGPVSDLKIDNIRDRSCRISWKPPREINGILTGYEIRFRKKNNNSSEETIQRTPETTSHTLNELQYETIYIISVMAKTKVGRGPAETTEIESGVPPELPGPPTGLAVTNIEARTVLLQFVPGYDGKSSISLWLVQGQVGDSTAWVEIYSISNSSANQILVRNLRPFTRYRLRILAKNIIDFSEPSEPCNQFETKQAAPGVPPADVTPRATSPTAIRLRWRQIPRDEWNGDYLGYKVSFRRWSKDVDVNTTSASDLALLQQTTWTTVELRNGSNIQEYTIHQLEEFMDYQVQMVSYNAVGSSSPSPVASERTEEGVPSASPVNIQLFATSSTTISVQWSPVPVLQQNGIIRGYKIRYKTNQMNEPMIQEVEGETTLRATLTGLRKYVVYSVQVSAFSRMGDGIVSPVASVRTSGDVPGPPVIIYFPQVTINSAKIVWEPPQEPNGKILNYRVAYRRKDQPQSNVDTSVDKPDNVFEHEVTGLAGETYYIFSVAAKTEHGWGPAASVEVYTIDTRFRPDPPYNLRVDASEILARSVTIIWTAGNDNFGPIRNFTVQYQEEGKSWVTVPGTIRPNVASYTVTGLRPNTKYSFRVAASNDVGMSDFSAQSTKVTTQADKPDGAPQNVKIVALTQTSIRISWEPPPETTWNGILTTDFVQYREEGGGSFREASVPYGTFFATLDKLTIGTRYEIQVLASNSAGRGPPSTPQVFRVGDVAPFSAPQDVRVTNKSSTELEVTWNPPPPETTNGELIGYKVLYWQSSSLSCEERSPIQRSVTELRLLLDKLTPYTIYCCTVQAVNIAGESPRSVVQAMRTSEDKPGRPENLRFENITLSELVILWDPPSVPNGKITHYELQYNVFVDGKKTNKLIEIRGEERRFYVTDLLENQAYTFTLAAYTYRGQGNVSEAVVTTGPQPGSPEAPLQALVTEKVKSITLTWENQGQGQSPIRGYHIRFQEGDRPGEWQPIMEVNSPEPSAQILLTELKPATEYRFRVRAINSQGISHPSPPSELYKTPSSLALKSAQPVYTEWWFLVIIALCGVILILLVITLLCIFERRRSKANELKRSATNTTVVSGVEGYDNGGFSTLELRQSRRSVKSQNNIYARSPPRPSPASVTYAESPPIARGAMGGGAMGGGAMAAAAIKPPSDTSSMRSGKLSLSSGDSSDDSDSSDGSIAKPPIPASPVAFYGRGGGSSGNNNNNNSSSGAGASSSSQSHNRDNASSPSWRFQSPHNAYTYTDSEAESSHYAFSLNNGNIVVNNVAGARTPLSGFSSFV